MHEITFSTDDKPKLLSQVFDSFSDQNVVYIRTIAFLNKYQEFGVHHYGSIYYWKMIDGWELRQHLTRLEQAFNTNLHSITQLG